MALYTGTASSVTNMLQTLVSLLVANHGYANPRPFFIDGGTPNRGQASISKNGNHWHFASTTGAVAAPSTNMPVPVAFMKDQSQWLAMPHALYRPADSLIVTGSGNTNGVLNTWQQSGIPFYGSSADPAYCRAAGLGSIDNYWLFVEDTGTGDEEFVWLVMEYDTKRFAHLAFGEVSKGSVWAGGAWMYGSHHPWDIGSGGAPQPLWGFMDVHSWVKVTEVTPSGDYGSGARFGWQCSDLNYQNTVNARAHGIVTGNTVETNYLYQYNPRARNIACAAANDLQFIRYHQSFNEDTGRMRLMPINVMVESIENGSQYHMHPLGRIPNIHPMATKVFYGGEFVDRGGERYYVFPINYRVDPYSMDDVSLNINPTELWLSNNWGIGIAIRKP